MVKCAVLVINQEGLWDRFLCLRDLERPIEIFDDPK